MQATIEFLDIGENFDELSVLVSHPDDVRRFLSQLIKYDEVITSALHVLIACQSYGIPCSLITFEGLENSVSGTGLKYADYSLGVGLKEIVPVIVERDLRRIPLDDIRQTQKISDSKKDEIEQRLYDAIHSIWNRKNL